MSNLITKIAAAAVFAGLLATSAQAQSKKPFEGVVLVAAVPMDEIQPKPCANSPSRIQARQDRQVFDRHGPRLDRR